MDSGLRLIERLYVWLRLRKREIAFAAVVFFVSSLSFGLGYLANRDNYRAPIIIEKCSTSS